MTTDELCAKLAALFPFFFNDPARASERLALYRQALGGAAGPRLAVAYRATLASWKNREPPLPAHFAEHLPPLAVRPMATTRRDPAEIDALMRALVVTPLGREIVAAGWCLALEERIARRAVNGLGEVTLWLLARLEREQAAFTAALQAVETGTATFAPTMAALGHNMQARQARANQRWAAWLAAQDGGAQDGEKDDGGAHGHEAA